MFNSLTTSFGSRHLCWPLAKSDLKVNWSWAQVCMNFLSHAIRYIYPAMFDPQYLPKTSVKGSIWYSIQTYATSPDDVKEHQWNFYVVAPARHVHRAKRRAQSTPCMLRLQPTWWRLKHMKTVQKRQNVLQCKQHRLNKKSQVKSILKFQSVWGQPKLQS